MKRVVSLLGLLFFSVCLSGVAQDTATIVGSVIDPTGSAIPNAKVKVENADKGFAGAAFCLHDSLNPQGF